ncbi:hypothetical protein [Microbacterium kunmingense]|uniref:hypothetical protein n=1 Tax=Microbacterium kunmingense TaxID=2915939 RepID=UPI0020033519|nr:hypothetical protein [Microbacterium kunmingense]
MDSAVPGRNPRLAQLVLAGLGVAIGWMLVSFVLGLSSSSALADESQDSGGLLGAVTTVAESGTEAVGPVAQPVVETAGDVVGGGTATVEKVAEPVADAVDTVAEPVLDMAGEAVGEIVGGGAVVVNDAVGALTGTAGSAVDGVTDKAGVLLDAAPLQPIVTPVADVASSALDTVGDVVESVGEQGPVSGVVGVVTDVVEHTPIVGDVAEELGLPDAVEQVGGSLDGGLGSIGETIGESGDNVAPAAPIPALPVVRPPLSTDRPETGPSLVPSTSIVDVAVPETQKADAAETASLAASGILQLFQSLYGASPAPIGPGTHTVVTTAEASDASTIPAVAFDRGGPFDSPGGVLPGDATAAASGGAGFGAWGLIAFGPLFAYRAWMRRAGPDDDRLPGAPIYDTDSSPD